MASKQSIYVGLGKRCLDVVVALLSLVLLSWLFALTALTVKLCLGGPILFEQMRAGRDGSLFKMVKFRTMTQLRDEQGSLLPDAQRLTGVGRFLRASSLDELPELWNVLKGDMSIVGPRPLLPEYLPRYSIDQARRHEVRPGLTGWAQVNGRNRITWEKRFELDVWYVDHLTLLLDLRILAATVLRIATAAGASTAVGDTMPVFLGSQATGGETRNRSDVSSKSPDHCN